MLPWGSSRADCRICSPTLPPHYPHPALSPQQKVACALPGGVHLFPAGAQEEGKGGESLGGGEGHMKSVGSRSPEGLRLISGPHTENGVTSGL